jgi:hypothetical protein
VQGAVGVLAGLPAVPLISLRPAATPAVLVAVPVPVAGVCVGAAAAAAAAAGVAARVAAGIAAGIRQSVGGRKGCGAAAWLLRGALLSRLLYRIATAAAARRAP